MSVQGSSQYGVKKFEHINFFNSVSNFTLVVARCRPDRSISKFVDQTGTSKFSTTLHCLYIIAHKHNKINDFIMLTGAFLPRTNHKLCMKLISGEIKGADPVVTLAWFICPTLSMVTTSMAGGLEKTLLSICFHSLLQGSTFQPVRIELKILF